MPGGTTATTRPAPGPAAPAPTGAAPGRGAGTAAALRPLVIDVGVPLGSYCLLHAAFGLTVWLSLALSSIAPAIRAAFSLAAERRPNLLAMLMLAVNLAGIAVSLLTGDPRAMIAKDSLVSSVIAIAILASVAARRPLMSAGLKPFLTKERPERTAAWDRLSACSSRFRRLEKTFSAIWGLLLLADCAARLAGAYTLPVTTMVWLSTVLTLGAVGLGILAGGVAAAPIRQMIEAGAAAGSEAASFGNAAGFRKRPLGPGDAAYRDPSEHIAPRPPVGRSRGRRAGRREVHCDQLEVRPGRR
jgi:hypothetical protein